jgi:3-oxoacyl-[acyl-carrier protein] reductase
MDLATARILVTGGSRGIGRATAALLRERGAQVAIGGRDVGVLEEAARALGAAPVAGDVSRPAEVTRLVGEAAETLGGLDALVNNAAIGTFAPFLETDPADLERVWRVNVLGAFLVGQACARRFVAQGHGTIVNVGSTAARKGFPGGTSYASSKFALSGLTECWRSELRTHGVRVMQVNPSEVQTAFGGGAQPARNPTKLQAEDIAQAIADLLALDDRGFVTETTIWATNPR